MKQKQSTKTPTPAQEIATMAIVAIGAGILLLCLELPAWVAAYGFNFWEVLK